MIYLISNTRSGSYSKEKIKEIEKELERHSTEFLTGETVKPGRLVTLDIDPASISKGDTIIAAGGDGTVNACLQYIHDNQLAGKVKLGIIPLGTGNNLIGSLNLTKNIKKAVGIILKSKTEKISYGLINDKKAFFNCSFGFTSFVLKNRKTNSLYGYAWDGLRLIPAFKGCNTVFAGTQKQINIFAGFFINTKFYLSKFKFIKINNSDTELPFFYIEKNNPVVNGIKSLSALTGISKWSRMSESTYTFSLDKNCLLEIDGDVYVPEDHKGEYTLHNASTVEVITNNG
ncbi:MAG: diacylglycerol kinase family protein [Candidatus Delongbacteria bacterium]